MGLGYVRWLGAGRHARRRGGAGGRGRRPAFGAWLAGGRHTACRLDDESCDPCRCRRHAAPVRRSVGRILGAGHGSLTCSPDGIAADAEGSVWVADPVGRTCLRVRGGGEVVATLDPPGGQSVFACGSAVQGEQTCCCAAHRMPCGVDGCGRPTPSCWSAGWTCRLVPERPGGGAGPGQSSTGRSRSRVRSRCIGARATTSPRL